MDWTGWSQVSAGTLENATDLRNVAGAMSINASIVDGLRLVMTAPNGWPFWASFAALGATVDGNTMTREWASAPGTSLVAAAEVLAPLFAAAVQDTIMTSGPIVWTLYQHKPGGVDLSFITKPITDTAGAMAQGIADTAGDMVKKAADTAGNAAADAINKATSDLLKKTEQGIPWVPILIVSGGVILLLR